MLSPEQRKLCLAQRFRFRKRVWLAKPIDLLHQRGRAGIGYLPQCGEHTRSAFGLRERSKTLDLVAVGVPASAYGRLARGKREQIDVAEVESISPELRKRERLTISEHQIGGGFRAGAKFEMARNVQYRVTLLEKPLHCTSGEFVIEKHLPRQHAVLAVLPDDGREFPLHFR